MKPRKTRRIRWRSGYGGRWATTETPSEGEGRVDRSARDHRVGRQRLDQLAEQGDGLVHCDLDRDDNLADIISHDGLNKVDSDVRSENKTQADKAHDVAENNLQELVRQIGPTTPDQSIQLAIVAQLNAIRAELRSRKD